MWISHTSVQTTKQKQVIEEVPVVLPAQEIPGSERIAAVDEPDGICSVSAYHIPVQSSKNETMMFKHVPSVQREDSVSCEGSVMELRVETAVEIDGQCVDIEEPPHQLALESHDEVESFSNFVVTGVSIVTYWAANAI